MTLSQAIVRNNDIIIICNLTIRAYLAIAHFLYSSFYSSLFLFDSE